MVYLTVKEVAERLRCSPRTVHHYITRERLPVVVLSTSKTNKHVLVSEESLGDWIRDRETVVNGGKGTPITTKPRPRRKSILTQLPSAISLKPFENETRATRKRNDIE